ncbi:MAG: DUF2283 domain-containing protein [Alphaproteobacteria bacterium]
MNVKYFSDTDTALLEFAQTEIAETKEVNENIYIDLDANGQVVNMTIEHAKSQSNFPHFSFTQYDGDGASAH